MNRRAVTPDHRRVATSVDAANGPCHNDILQAIAGMTRAFDGLAAEMRCLRLHAYPCSLEIIQELCSAIFDTVGCQKFTAVELFDWATQDGIDSTERIYNAARLAIKGNVTIMRLAQFLSESCGAHGQWRLKVRRSNNGNVFVVEKIK